MRGDLLRAGLFYPGEHPDVTKRRDDISLLTLRIIADDFQRRYQEATPDTDTALAISELDDNFLLDKLALWDSDIERRSRATDELNRILLGK